MDTHEIQPSPRYLFRQPLALQWFESGKLVKRHEEERQAGRFELFLDLLYVAILANFAETLAEDISGAKLVKYILIFAPSWHVWSDLRELMNSFYNDDLLQRVLILWVMSVLVMYGNNAPLVDEDISAMRATVGSYMVARISGSAAHLLYSFASYHHRAQQRLWVTLTLVSLCIYIPLYFESISVRSKIAVAAVGICAEEFSWVFCFSPAAKKMLKAKYTTAVNIAHEVDRYAAFYIVVLGEYLYQIVVGSPAAVGFNLGLLHAVWTLVIAFCLNWMYVHNDGALKSTHPFRYSVYTAFSWATLHLPLSASLLASGHVAAASAAEDRFRDPERWLLCGSLGAGLYCLYALALLSEDKDAPGTLMLPKHLRMIMRPIIGLIIILLGLARDLNITSIMSIIMALIVFCLIWENITSLHCGAGIWERWENTTYPEQRTFGNGHRYVEMTLLSVGVQ
ncbi:bacterial low temperature requirement A protein-domain-containing protein [Aspergillus avenaceus]|uniref:Bacterial low temperature requirement A protein-domain-containing protein n=1 Tax=Aspergillus avenaceus TaxID=36643 RepID=A0A5N6U1J9_ASPAV|nr:bacterial low temperature requirement A protein-domain-containing protein [Aspergillus avenaceus]